MSRASIWFGLAAEARCSAHLQRPSALIPGMIARTMGKDDLQCPENDLEGLTTTALSRSSILATTVHGCTFASGRVTSGGSQPPIVSVLVVWGGKAWLQCSQMFGRPRTHPSTGRPRIPSMQANGSGRLHQNRNFLILFACLRAAMNGGMANGCNHEHYRHRQR